MSCSTARVLLGQAHSICHFVKEFQNFYKRNGIKPITGPPFSMKNNGQAEITVKGLKQVEFNEGQQH